MARQSPILTVGQAQALLGVSDEQVRKLLRRGQLRGFYIPPRTTRIYRESVEALISDGELLVRKEAKR